MSLGMSHATGGRLAARHRTGAVEVDYRPQHREMRERERKVPHQRPGARIELLGQESKVIGSAARTHQQRFSLLSPPHLSEHVDQPEGTDKERALVLCKYRLDTHVSIH